MKRDIEVGCTPFNNVYLGQIKHNWHLQFEIGEDYSHKKQTVQLVQVTQVRDIVKHVLSMYMQIS